MGDDDDHDDSWAGLDLVGDAISWRLLLLLAIACGAVWGVGRLLGRW